MWRPITSVQHPVVKHLVKLRQNRDYRYEHHALVVEGVKLVAELGAERSFKTLVTCNEALVPKGIRADEMLFVNDSVMKKISGMQTPEGIIAEIAMPPSASLNNCRRLLVLDGVSDPGNVGTLIRTALALGWEGAYIIEESCDPFNEKALRAARGATFRLPVAWGSWDKLQELIKTNKLTPLVADLHGKELADLKVPDGVVLVVGNEAHGPSKEALKLCQPVTIKMPGAMESLNVSVAGGILMYVLGKRT